MHPGRILALAGLSSRSPESLSPMACSTTRLVPSRLGLGFFLVLERVGMAHSGTNGTEPSRSAIFKLTHYREAQRRWRGGHTVVHI